MSKDTEKYYFPFIGAGEATYFEWAEISVVFINEPDENQKKLIATNVPKPIDDILWENNALSAGSDQFAHVHIAHTYSAEDNSNPTPEENEDSRRWFFATDSQVALFNQDIERWLFEIHQISPILIAYRPEDNESGGTDLSPWHDWSVQSIEDLIPQFEDVIENNDHHSIRSHVLKGLLEYSEEKVEQEERYQYFLNPGWKEVKSFINGDTLPLIQAVEKEDDYSIIVLEVITETMDIENQQDRQLLIKNAESLLNLKEKAPGYEFDTLCVQIWHSAYMEGDKILMEKVPRSEQLIEHIAELAYKKLTGDEFMQSIKLYEQIIDYPHQDLSIYCNALYVLQNDNSGLPVNYDLNKKFLSQCLKHAPENPAIFFNAACLYVEMGEYNQAYHMIKQAIEHNYKNIESMKNQILVLNFFKDFKQKTDVLKLFQ